MDLFVVKPGSISFSSLALGNSSFLCLVPTQGRSGMMYCWQLSLTCHQHDKYIPFLLILRGMVEGGRGRERGSDHDGNKLSGVNKA